MGDSDAFEVIFSTGSGDPRSISSDTDSAWFSREAASLAWAFLGDQSFSPQRPLIGPLQLSGIMAQEAIAEAEVMSPP
jgi:hypothetical protein